MTSLTTAETPIPGLIEVTRLRREDSRGYLSRLFCLDELAQAGWPEGIAQINMTMTAQAGTVRGLHFQRPPHAEAKFVTCLSGEVFDVAVDLRAGSPTYLRWYAAILSGANLKSLMIPEGFAHGFQTLTADCVMHYAHSSAYAPAFEGALHVADPRLAIAWPLPIEGLSARDAGHPFLTPEFDGIAL